MTSAPAISRRLEVVLVLFVTLVAFSLRSVWQWYAPRGWRDDELSNAFVVSQHVREGEVRLYYDDASGHEGLYHLLQAGTMTLFGPSGWGIRGVSILMGTLAVTLTYLLARRMFDWQVALLAALALAVSFWSLMYSRSGQRHITLTVMTLLGFLTLWHMVLKQNKHEGWRSLAGFALAGVWMGVGFYTYFASRGVPLIVAAWAVYLFIWARETWSKSWRGLLVTLGVAVVLALPLIVVLQEQPEAEARVAELAKPLYDLRAGDPSTLFSYAWTTLSMFTHDGDSEVLYNVAHRPVFGPLGGGLFWLGVLAAMKKAFGTARDPRQAFLLLWVGAGLVPGALSVPPASLGHTILAQSPVMILAALGLLALARWVTQHLDRINLPRGLVARGPLVALSVAFIGWEAWRGPYDYFIIWPQDQFARVLHHSDLHEASQWLNTQADASNLAIGGYLTERWDQIAMELDLVDDAWQIRAFNPDRAYVLIPDGGWAVVPQFQADAWGVRGLGRALVLGTPYTIRQLLEPGDLGEADPRARFSNGLALVTAEVRPEERYVVVTVTWRVERPLNLPPFPLLSKPPAPDEDDTPRLSVFMQALSEGQWAAGDDGLGVDPYTLHPGDVFVQRHAIDMAGLPPGAYELAMGLYDPALNVRISLESGGDTVSLGTIQRP